ncbi:MFS transporter [Halorarum halophilum]|uniref:MFS transporter n=1 Tax=Halorarum halophilum TaxID=2743090 RepID=A0A7D5KTK2_9EURY|nr:MFS transporter [Halobaculum halophilum]QLG26380.1 MFS transporter [Halobaculum halophilum]
MSRGRLFGTLCGAVFLVNLGRMVFAPLLSEFIAVFGLTAGTAGLLATLAWVGSAALRLPTGWVLTRVPRHHVVLATGALLTAAASFVAVADSLPVLMVGTVGMGLASGAYFVAANPLVSELFPNRVGRVMGIHGTASQLAAVAAAPVVTVALAIRWPLAVEERWRVVFVGIALGAATVTILLFFSARDAKLPEAGASDRDLLGGARREWRTVLTGVVILGAAGFLWQGVFNFFELYMGTKSIPPTLERNLLTVIFAAGVPAFLVSGRLADRFPHVPYMLSIVGAFVVALLGLVAAQGVLQVVLASAVLGLVVHSLFPAMDTYMLDTLPDETRGSAYAVYSGTMMFVQAGGSWAVGGLRDAGYAFDTVFSVGAVGLALLLVPLVVLSRLEKLPQ